MLDDNTITEQLSVKSSIQIGAPDAFGKDRMTPACEHFGAPAHLKAAETHMSDSLSGNIVRKHELRMMDLYHNKKEMDYNQFRNTVMYLNTRNEKGELVKDVFDDCVDYCIQKWYDIFNFGVEYSSGGNNSLPPWLTGEEDEDIEYPLEAFAERQMEYKLIFQIYWGARVEEIVANAIEDKFGYRVLRTSTDIAEATPFDDPEARGIDLWIVEEEIGVQVKEGTGGKTDDESTVMARYLWDNKEMPIVNLSKN